VGRPKIATLDFLRLSPSGSCRESHAIPRDIPRETLRRWPVGSGRSCSRPIASSVVADAADACNVNLRILNAVFYVIYIMTRILFRWRGINFYSYPVMLYFGFVIGILAGALAAPLEGVTADRFIVAAVVLVIPAMVGSRLLFVALHWNVYRREPARIWNRAEGGMALYGGLVLAMVVSPPLLSGIGISFRAFWDTATFSLLLGTAITRIGCLLNGCCCGRPTSGWLAIRLPNVQGVWRRRIPTQLLEAGFALTLFLALLTIKILGIFTGPIFPLALAAYGLCRLALEGTREFRDDILPLRLVSAALVVAALALILWRR
jgi:phosphatidylglycerol---prolipoprotein diacylglyceryl transferase